MLWEEQLKKDHTQTTELKLTNNNKIKKRIERTRNGGGEINRLMKKAAAYYAPASAAIAMAESFLNNYKRILPCATYLNGEYGVRDLYVGVPVIIGSKGVEKIIQLKLTPHEKKQFIKSDISVRKFHR